MTVDGQDHDPLDPPRIQITQVTYERLVNTGNYQNFKVSAAAAVNVGAPAEDAIAALRQFVDDECLAMTEALKRTDGVSSAYPSDLPRDLFCADCADAIKETRFRDGTVWSAAQLAAYGLRKHNRALCLKDYREANEVRRRGTRVEATY